MIARKLLMTICLFVAGILLSTIWWRHRLYLQILEESKLDHLIRVSGLSNLDINSIHSSMMTPPPPALVYLPTREGLTSRYRQLERMHSNARSHHRNLTVIDNHSVHYKDLGRICLCSIFVLPSSIHCSSAAVENVVKILKCTLPPVPAELHHLEQQWLFKPSNFGLQTFDSVNKVDTFSWNSTLCTLAFGFYFNISDKSHIIPIRFQEVYVSLYQAALRSLEQSFSASAELRPVLVVVHWRRGDQKDRCRRFEDVSVNCGTATNFIQKVSNVTTDYAKIHGRHRLLVYVATNEKDPSVLAQLESAGYKLFKHTRGINRDRGRPLSSLEAFLVELQLMIHADMFLGWGTTGVSQFVVRARREKAGEVGHAENFAVNDATR